MAFGQRYSVSVKTGKRYDSKTLTARRFLRRLVRSGLVARVKRGKYKLAPGVRKMIGRHLMGMENIHG
jgi:DNA-binding IclR family transcriptional regulator